MQLANHVMTSQKFGRHDGSVMTMQRVSAQSLPKGDSNGRNKRKDREQSVYFESTPDRYGHARTGVDDSGADAAISMLA